LYIDPVVYILGGAIGLANNLNLVLPISAYSPLLLDTWHIASDEDSSVKLPVSYALSSHLSVSDGGYIVLVLLL